MKRKMLCFVSALCIAGTMFSGFGSSAAYASNKKANDITTVKYIMPTADGPLMYNEVLALVNEKLAEEKGINIEIQYFPWEVYSQKLNLMMTVGEDIDIYHIMQERISLSSYHSMGGLADITDSVNEFGKNMLKTIDEAAWNSVKIGGRIYSVPVMWCELASEGVFTVREDVLDMYGLSMPETNEDLLDISETLMNNWEGSGKPYLMFSGSASALPLSSHTTVLHREYDSFPFVVKDTVAYITEDGTVKSWIETEEFKKDCEWFRDAYERGLINPDILSIPKEQVDNQRTMGNWAIFFGTGGSLSDLQKNHNPDITDDQLKYIKLYPEKPSIRYINVKNSNGISSISKKVDESVKFFDWLYTNQENYNLFMYGIEDETYVLGDGGTRTALRNDSNTRLYQHSDWMVGNINFILPDASTPSLQLPVLYEIDEKAENHLSADFFFDASVVETEFSNLTSEFAASVAPIYLGLQSYEDAFPAALKKMKAAGLDKVLAEYQKQLDEYLESR